MISAVQQNNLISLFIFSNQPGLRALRHLIFWALFLSVNLAVDSAVTYHFEGSRVLFYGMSIPFYYLSCYGLQKFTFTLKDPALLIFCGLMLLVAAHLFLMLIIAVQIHFPVFEKSGSRLADLYGFSGGAGPSGILKVLQWVLSDLSFLGVVMPAFVLKVSKGFYLLEKRRQDGGNEDLRQQLENIRNSLAPTLMLSLLQSASDELSLESEKAGAILESASSVINYSLNETGKEFVPLPTELNAIEKLLYIQSIRFSQRFDSSFTVEGDALESHRIPSMLLYMLVDHGLQQTVYHNSRSTSLAVNVKITGTHLHFELVQYISESILSPRLFKGQWQDTLCQFTLRAKSYYPGRFKTEISQQDRHLTVSVMLPLS